MPDEREAWVRIPTEAELMASPDARPPDHPYYFGFVAGMGRLLIAHPRIGAAFQALYAEIMFSPASRLTRAEREMVAAVAASAQFCHY